MSKWIPINEYSVKKGISPSTLRRKIKSNKIKHKVEQGRYLLYDHEGSSEDQEYEEITDNGTIPNPNMEELLNFAEKSVSTITKLHQNLLEEKDKRIAQQDIMIQQLKQEISELRMLVKVLETSSPDAEY